MNKKRSTQVKVEATINCPPKADTKMLRKEKVVRKLHDFGKLKRKTTRILKGRNFKAFVIIAEGRATSPKIASLRKSPMCRRRR